MQLICAQILPDGWFACQNTHKKIPSTFITTNENYFDYFREKNLPAFSGCQMLDYTWKDLHEFLLLETDSLFAPKGL